MNFLSLVRLATAAEVEALRAQLEAEREMTTKLSIAIDHQRAAIKEQALQLADARDEIDAGEGRRSRLQAELDRVYVQHQELVLRYDEANALIQRLQSERPQMRLVRNEEAAGRRARRGRRVVHGTRAGISTLCSGTSTFIRSAFSSKGRLTGVSAPTITSSRCRYTTKSFSPRVRAGEQLFGHGSVIRAEFIETTYRRPDDGEPYTERTLEHVIEVIPPPATTNTQLEIAGTPEGAPA